MPKRFSVGKHTVNRVTAIPAFRNEAREMLPDEKFIFSCPAHHFQPFSVWPPSRPARLARHSAPACTRYRRTLESQRACAGAPAESVAIGGIRMLTVAHTVVCPQTKPVPDEGQSDLQVHQILTENGENCDTVHLDSANDAPDSAAGSC